MSDEKRTWSERFYAALLRVLPFDFRSEFGSEMEETFRAQHADTERQKGVGALASMWWATIRDILRMAPREHVSVLAQDTRYALRMMRKNSGYTAAAVLILGLGIGVNTSIFSVVNSVLLQPLPYAQGDDLVVLRQPQTRMHVEDAGFSPMELNDYRQQTNALSQIEEYHYMNFLLLGKDEAHRVKVGVVSAHFFDLLGVKPLRGRTFVPDDERKDAPAVLVLSYEFWKETEGSDPNIIGKVYQMNDKPHTVIGVLPRIPQYPNENDVYMPTSACPARSNPANQANRGFRLMSVFGRLKPGKTVEFCRRDMATINARFQQDFPKFYPERSGFSANASALRNDLTNEARPMLLALLGAAAFVLLIACANVANLILARMARREQELVIRTAVGAGSGRLLRQLLTESLIMAILSAGVGMVFAAASMRLLVQFAGLLTPRAREIAIDGWVLAFAAACACITTIAFGSAAALYTRHNVAAGLKEGGRASADKSRSLVRGALIAAQVAFSYVLLIGAGLMVRSFGEMSRVDPGFAPQHLFAVRLSINFNKYNSAELRMGVVNRLMELAARQPGAMSVAMSSSFPMDPEQVGGNTNPSPLHVEGDTRSEAELPGLHSIRSASPDYFKTLGIPVVAGRAFTDSDKRDAPLVCILNKALAQRAWPNQDPIGRRVSFNFGPNRTWFQVVGVVGSTKEFGLGTDTPNQIYVPLLQNPNPAVILLRTAGDSSTVADSMLRSIHEMDPQIAIVRSITLEQARAYSLASPRTMARLFGLFAALALVIAITGIGGMLALWVRQRTQEIGIRIAMGAQPMDIVRSVIQQGMVLVAIGLSLGLAGALIVTRALTKLLFHVQPTDVPTYVLVSAALITAAMVACWVPARRASRIDPLVALRRD